MAGRIKISVSGAAELRAVLDKKADLKAVKQVVKKNGKDLQNKAQRKAPVDTGELKSSIGLEITNGGMSAEVEPTKDYAPYPEYGTRFMDAQPYMWPSLKEQEPKFINDLSKTVKRGG